MWNRGNIESNKERMELASPASSLSPLFFVPVWSESVPTMAHKSNPYKKSRAKFRWKWKNKRTSHR